MRLLLDTHVLLWAAAGTLPAELAEHIADEDNDLHFSPASIWEIVIKKALGRPDFTVDPTQLHRALIATGYREVPITGRATLQVATLPDLHKDPFDRVLVAQAIEEGLTLLTADRSLAGYPGGVMCIPGPASDHSGAE
ncbi:MAG: type II toxin-antitoxin system VapC family toxin [Propionibacteriaceae bacterium]|nr:type II toxin-antitoxin system VapC family toxin [Propionibacteriaceae bacterium]